MVRRVRGIKTTGLNLLKDKHPGETAIICCAGTSFKNYNDSIVPREWKRFAVNETIRGLGDKADFWVLADREIVFKYAMYCPSSVTILAMREAVGLIEKHRPENKIYTVESMRDVKDYTNGHEFFSRGTVAIGAVEMARFMGFKQFFFFGLDCYRTQEDYYFDGRKPQHASECKAIPKDAVKTRTKERLFVTPKLKRMIQKLDETLRSGLWDSLELWCVDSEHSQQNAIDKMTIEEFKKEVEDAAKKTKVVSEPSRTVVDETGKSISFEKKFDAEWQPDKPKRKRGRPRKQKPDSADSDRRDKMGIVGGATSSNESDTITAPKDEEVDKDIPGGVNI